jgi:uncharacterized beta barrel domain-containing protein DUF5777
MPKSSVQLLTITVLFACLLSAPIPALAQGPASAAPEPQAVTSPPELPSEPELNLINLGTTRSLDRHQSYFRITHRFQRDLGSGSFGELAENLFSLDNGAVIGLEYRFGITDRLQAGVNRTTLAKTIQFLSRYDALRQGPSSPLSISIGAAIEGIDNFHEHRQPVLNATVSRKFNQWLMAYAVPTVVWHSEGSDTAGRVLPGAEEDGSSQHEQTLFVGLGARVRFRPTAYVVGEYTPRLAGNDPQSDVWGVAVEAATHGHTFQVNFTNTFGTLPGQIARGGADGSVYLGFNITRRF